MVYRLETCHNFQAIAIIKHGITNAFDSHIVSSSGVPAEAEAALVARWVVIVFHGPESFFTVWAINDRL